MSVAGDQRGFTLLAVVIAIAIINVLAATVVAGWSEVMQRERELEAIWRGEQYGEALVCHEEKRGRAPKELEELLETHCIRRLFADPLSESGAWRLVRVRDIRPEQEGEKEAALGDLEAEPGAGEFVEPGTGDSLGGTRRTAFRDRLTQARREWQRPEATSPSGSGAAEVAEPVGGQDPDAIVAVASAAEGSALLAYRGSRRYELWQFGARRRSLPTGPWSLLPTETEEETEARDADAEADEGLSSLREG